MLLETSSILDDWSDNGSYYKSKDKEVKNQVKANKFLISTDRLFYCKKMGQEVRASMCSENYIKKVDPCRHCPFGQMAAGKEKPDKKQNEKRDTVLTVTENKENKEDIENKSNLLSLDHFKKHRRVDSNRGRTPKITLHRKILSFNSAIMDVFCLGDRRYVDLYYLEDHNMVAVKFLYKYQKTPDSYKLTNKKRGDARVCIAGFRAQNGISNTGQFAVSHFDPENKVLFVELKRGR